MFGIFFEDINFGADGGLYPELVKNRSFEFNEPLTGWHEVLGFSGKGLDPPKGELDIRTDAPLNQHNPHYLSVRAFEPGYGLYNSASAESAFKKARSTASPPMSAPTAQRAIRAVVTRRKIARPSPPESSKASTITGRNTKPSSAPTPRPTQAS